MELQYYHVLVLSKRLSMSYVKLQCLQVLHIWKDDNTHSNAFPCWLCSK